MEISVYVEQVYNPDLDDVRPHYCPGLRRLVGLRFTTKSARRELFCPWCGTLAPEREPGHRYDRCLPAKTYDGPLCEHGRPDVTCVALASADEFAAYELLCGSIREYRAAELAQKYGGAPAVSEWVRACGDCREAIALKRRPILRYELDRVAKALAADVNAVQRTWYALRRDVQLLHEAFAELDRQVSCAAAEPQRTGFVYLIGHKRAVKIGWTEKHPATPGGRLYDLQIGSCDELELLGLIEASFPEERQVQDLFAHHRIRGEWFTRHEEILAYFDENGIAV